jgi:hypothetical protein
MAAVGFRSASIPLPFFHWISTAALWTVVLWASWHCIGLNSDGAVFFLQVLHKGGFTTYGDQPRQYAIGLVQIPLVAGLRAGVTDLHWLARLFSFGTLAVPAVFYQLALYRAKDDALLLLLVVVALSAIFMTACLFSVGEYNTAYAVAVAATTYAASRQAPRLSDGIVLLLLGVIALRSYEAFVYLGPIVAAVILFRTSGEPLIRHRVLNSLLFMAMPAATVSLALSAPSTLPIAILFLAMLLVAVATLWPRHGGVATNAAHTLAAALFMTGAVLATAAPRLHALAEVEMVTLRSIDFWRNPVSALTLLALLALTCGELLRSRLLRAGAFLLVLALACLPLLQWNQIPAEPLAQLHYGSRTIGGLLAAGIAAIASTRLIGGQAAARNLVFAVSMLLATLPSTLYAAAEWSVTIADLQGAIRSQHGTIAFERAPPTVRRWLMKEQAFLPTLSHAARSHVDDGIVAPSPEADLVVPLLDIDGRYVWRD